MRLFVLLFTALNFVFCVCAGALYTVFMIIVIFIKATFYMFYYLTKFILWLIKKPLEWITT